MIFLVPLTINNKQGSQPLPQDQKRGIMTNCQSAADAAFTTLKEDMEAKPETFALNKPCPERPSVNFTDIYIKTNVEHARKVEPPAPEPAFSMTLFFNLEANFDFDIIYIEKMLEHFFSDSAKRHPGSGLDNVHVGRVQGLAVGVMQPETAERFEYFKDSQNSVQVPERFRDAAANFLMLEPCRLSTDPNGPAYDRSLLKRAFELKSKSYIYRGHKLSSPMSAAIQDAIDSGQTPRFVQDRALKREIEAFVQNIEDQQIRQVLASKLNVAPRAGETGNAFLERALRNAAANNAYYCIAPIIRAGANINAQDSTPTSRKTALQLAVERKHFDTALCLVKEGANPNIADANENTAFKIVNSMVIRADFEPEDTAFIDLANTIQDENGAGILLERIAIPASRFTPN